MTTRVRTSVDDDVAVIEIDNPPVNAIDPGVAETIAGALGDAIRPEGIAAVVVRGAGRMFSAGVDITTLEAAVWGDDAAAPDLHHLLAQVENCPKPVVMAIHGAALGGGLELAMAGHYRIASAGAQIGQPEVRLGVIPGAEGTQRLPRLAGVERALDMCVTGRPLSAADAIAAGIVDELADGDLTESAVRFARRVSARGRHVRTRDRRDRLGDPGTNAPLLAAARDLARRTRPRETAPLLVVDAIEAATALAFDDGCRREREIFLDGLRSEQARALIHVFFSERSATKRGIAAVNGASPLGDRLVSHLRAEVQCLIDDGVSAERINLALLDFGMTMPPVEAAGGIRPRAIGNEEIVGRSVCILINEGARSLYADAAVRAADVDVAAVAACGFPAWRGGPMFHADRIGLAEVLNRIEALQQEYGERWRPAPLLVELAAAGGTFRDWDRTRLQ